MEKATFAAGCFWGVQELFRKQPGIINTRVGYTGGTSINPTYQEVCRDNTGHAEAIEIEFDPEVISYQQLLELFWNNHNPTTLNRQGPDFGSQYRSAIFYHNAAQKELALTTKENLTKENKFPKPIVTEILPVTTFYPAEEYHQNYLEKRNKNQCS